MVATAIYCVTMVLWLLLLIGWRAGSSSSAQCEYHVWAVLARRLPTHYVVVAALVLAFLVFNCLYGLIVSRRQLTSQVDQSINLATQNQSAVNPL